ncbi:GRB10-interacting GYF protein 2 isoform X3 [Anabas testudineus]|uniref:GRB10-interacting GYF protein 2 isoform X3 n=1 Tax=Anabas testudineus TaxID=64144 RepID=UPI000E45FDC4|nr:GRB10-interacting GYF protein 2 isoform X3 [Anabas testudineus]
MSFASSASVMSPLPLAILLLVSFFLCRLRALSGGGGGSGGSSNAVVSPPLSPAMPKYKLAEYRYGREEMLALYVKDNKIPIDLHDKEFLPILQEEPLPPLALVSFTEEEQRNFSMSVNSAAVLRLTGRGGGPIAGAPRGRSTSRGRGRGRGDGGFYQRSFDDVEGFGRGGREMHRSQSWEERGDRRFEKPGRKEPEVAPGHFQMNHIRGNYEDGGAGLPRKHDFTRSESENWRTSRDDQNGEDDEGGWRLAGSRRDSDRWCPPSPDGPRSAGWREHPDQRRRFPFDAREDERGYRRPRSGSGSLEDERDSLPEWCLEDADEEAGTFDSSGAFLSLKKASKEPILEEAELDFRPLEECEEGLEEEEDSQPNETKETEAEAKREVDRKELPRVSEEPPPVAPPAATPVLELQVPVQSLSSSQPSRTEETERPIERQPPLELPPEPCKIPLHVPMSNSMLDTLPMTHISTTLTVSAPSPSIQLPLQKPMEVPVAMNNPLPFPSNVLAPIGRPTTVSHDTDEDEGLKHFEQEAEKMVAYLQDGVVDDDRLAAKTSEKPKPAGLPLTHEAALKWFYKDPQGEMQGPFSNHEMTEWFQAGYFTMSLLVKRGCDEVFQPLGEIMKIWGRVPFTPGPAPPPLQGDDQERLKRQQELTALNLYQLQQLQYQYLLRQQYAQALAQQKAAVLSSAPLQQQQQHQQQINLLQQQYQALKIRASESLLPPVTRSLSVPDSGSVWEMQNPSSQASCTPNIQQAAASIAWDGNSVWDLPIDSMAQAPTIEQMQQLEKAKTAKMELERREAEMRAKREEEERKRLEALRARQEEERKRLEEEERARQIQEEALRQQREQEEAQRRQKEEEERLAQEEALRRLEERRREEEERKKREEYLRKQQEEERRKQEELEALRRREEEKRAEEEAAAAAVAAALAQQQQEEQKRREQEAQRQQELLRQRQQQQEALRRLQQQQQQQQLAQMKLPSSSKWGQQSTNAVNQTQNALSLAEIQKVEEERERQTREEQRRQQQELLKLQQQQALQQAQHPQSKLSGWGNVAKQPVITKSLLEIQREEAQQMKQRKEQQPQQHHHPIVTQQTRAQNRTTSLSNSVWGSVNTSTNWGSESSSIWGDTHNSNMGFWDEAVKEAVQQPPQTRKGNTQKNNKGNANLSNSLSGRANKKVEEEEKLLKLFQGVNKSQQDTFMQWCEQTLHTLNTANNLDVPTFASFLKEVDSPYEVHDYVRAYLGDTPEAKDFAKQFLERRAKQNGNQQKQVPQNQQQALKQQQDSVWGGTGSSSLYQSNHTSGQQQRFETVTSGKKKKKQKMVRADPSLLGFSVNASSERLNMGEIETLEDF